MKDQLQQWLDDYHAGTRTREQVEELAKKYLSAYLDTRDEMIERA